MEESNVQDVLLMACVRRSDLDTLWSRASTTVASNRSLIRQKLENSKSLGLEGPFLDYGPDPSEDTCGREVALAILMK